MRAIATRRLPLLAGRLERRWALRDVTLEAAPGRSIGVIGRNGAGKSTLLRLASGLGRADRGTIRVPDGTASVLSLGDTFDPSLSGRENALTAAIVAGWSRSGARRLLPRILEFAELSEAAEAPVRTYSDGMRLRLAFGVVAQLSPSVLLLDEVITVGDLAFQARCMDRIREMRGAGTTLVLASHDLQLVERECDAALWLEDGRQAAAGDAADVVARYEQAAHDRTLAATPEPSAGGEEHHLELGHSRVGTQEARLEAVRLDGTAARGRIAPGDPLTISMRMRSETGPLLDPIVAVSIHSAGEEALCFESNTRDRGVALGRIEDSEVRLSLERVDLPPGRYLIDVGLYRNDWDLVYDYHWHAYELEVTGASSGRGILAAPHRWEASG